jgi:hypothetical protein
MCVAEGLEPYALAESIREGVKRCLEGVNKAVISKIPPRHSAP